MAPQRFKIGQEVTTITAKIKYKLLLGPCDIPPAQRPKPGTVYTVSAYEPSESLPGEWMITLSELAPNHYWRELEFSSVVSDTALTELLEESLQPQTI